MDISQYECEREALVDQATSDQLNELLSSPLAFDALESGYEFLSRNADLIRQALWHLDGAFSKQEHSQRAVNLALGQLYRRLETHCRELSEKETADAYTLYENHMQDQLDAQRERARDKRLGI